MKKTTITYLVLCTIIIFSSCATFKSNIIGKYDQAVEKNYKADKVNVLFEFSHYRQNIGFDAIPKLDNQYERIKGFDDFFLDALNEISNIKSYATFTNYSSDVGDSKRRAKKDSLIKVHDIVIKMKFVREKKFTKFFFGTIASSITATIIPIKYKYDYAVVADVYNSEQQLIKSYSRNASLNKWVQTFMVFLYPFYHEKRKKEELYVEFMHDIFKQIESEKVLTPQD